MFGLVYGLIVWIVSNHGIIAAVKDTAAAAILCALFGLVAGALYGLWAAPRVRSTFRGLRGAGSRRGVDSRVNCAALRRYRLRVRPRGALGAVRVRGTQSPDRDEVRRGGRR